ncbi:collagen binding domain-containing protein [Streptomyces yangpuensis]|uniref:MSCRAMM family protein n=1 Tax=Streptomyces yangpuensis TaxID=1648182 RepID=UPI003658E8C4
MLRSTDLDTGTPLPGARFELWRETNDRAGLQSTGQGADQKSAHGCVTGPKGLCTMVPATGETYYAVQVAVPAGYEPPDEPFTGFDFGEDAARNGFVVDVPNRRRDAAYGGGVRVRTKDGKTGAPLPGAVFELWRDTDGTTGLQTAGVAADQRVRPGCATDADGTCDFEALADGAYFLVTKDVPEGYVMPKAPVAGPWRLDTASGRRLLLTVHIGRAERIPEVGEDQRRRKGHPPRAARAGAPPE